MPPGPSKEISEGTLIDNLYEVEGVLGSGGFATVYKARQTKLNRSVALKVLDDLRSSDPKRNADWTRRFMNEAQAAASISHKHVVTIHDFGICENIGRPYIVMEHLAGHDLEDEIQKAGAMDPARVVKLLTPVLEALGAGHAMGIIHKDLKPSNLFLTHPGTPRESMILMDYGVARFADSEKKTTTGKIIGTPQYYAPEYVRDQIATPALDVYQMGLILVEMLIGEAVVASSDHFVCLHRHCTGNLEVPEVIQQSALGPVIDRALQLDHTARYEDCEAFKVALAAIDPAMLTPLDLSMVDKGGVRRIVKTIEEDETMEQKVGGYVPTVQGGGLSEKLKSELKPDTIAPKSDGPSPRTKTFALVAAVVLVAGVALGGIFGKTLLTGDGEGATEREDRAPISGKMQAKGAAEDKQAPKAPEPAKAAEDTKVPDKAPEPVAEVAPDAGDLAVAAPADPERVPCAKAPEVAEGKEAIEVIMTSTPTGAMIRHDKKMLGETPCLWVREKGQGGLVQMMQPSSGNWERVKKVPSVKDGRVEHRFGKRSATKVAERRADKPSDKSGDGEATTDKKGDGADKKPVGGGLGRPH